MLQILPQSVASGKLEGIILLGSLLMKVSHSRGIAGVMCRCDGNG
jgi:hypothetical protein